MGARVAIIMASILLGATLAVGGLVGSHAVERGLEQGAESALSAAGITGVTVRFTGREAIVSSVTASTEQLERARAVVAGIDGARWVDIAAPIAAVAPTAPALTVAATGAGTEAGTVAVTGTVATAEEDDALRAQARGTFGATTRVDITVDPAVGRGGWIASAPQLFAALAPIAGLAFSVQGTSASLAGTVADVPATESAIRAALPGILLTSALERTPGPTTTELALLAQTEVLFGADSAQLTGTEQATLSSIATLLAAYPQLRLTLTGHIAIPTGTAADAVAFSVLRARAVADGLVARGVDGARLTVAGVGTADPVGDNGTSVGAASNRRVSFSVTEG